MRKQTVVPVVLVYLVGNIGNISHVLLMRRGAGVAYMKNAWSIIAGVVNGDISLERQALVEIAGETSLLQGDVSDPEVIGTFEDADADTGKTWVRNLMLSTVHKRSEGDAKDLKVRLDWEHSEAAWVPVRDVLAWLSNERPEDPVAREILCNEPATPDFRLNFERMRRTFEKWFR